MFQFLVYNLYKKSLQTNNHTRYQVKHSQSILIIFTHRNLNNPYISTILTMKLTYSIPIYKYSNLTQISRINNSIYGYDIQQQSFAQIDIKHSCVYGYKLQSVSTSALLNCKYIQNYNPSSGDSKQYGQSAYFCVFDKKIQKYSFLSDCKWTGGLLKSFKDNIKEDEDYVYEHKEETKDRIILASNSMASFTGMFDAYRDSLVFVKLHENHGKYSLNWLQGVDKQKKILKLIDFNPKSIILNHYHPQIIYTDPQNQVKYFDLQKPNIQSLLVKKSIILFDRYNIYSTSTNLVSKFNDTYEIQSIDLKTGKLAFSFKGNRIPKKVEAYGNNIFYLSDTYFSIYDKRKLEPLEEVKVDGGSRNGNGMKDSKGQQKGFFMNHQQRRMNDFILEPNLGKIVISLTHQMRQYKYNFF